MTDRQPAGAALSGRQHTLRSGDYEASVASVGATLRALTFAGRDLILPFPAHEMRPEYRGAILAPWPNRVTDGRYEFDGRRHQLPLNEPELGHALHGLAHWLDFATVDASTGYVGLSADLQSQDGYPFRVRVTVRYELDAGGLTTTVAATNTGVVPAPFGIGAHPYLVAGNGVVDDWELQLPAGDVLVTTPDRLVPVAVRSAVELGTDYRQRRPLRGAILNHAFTGLIRTNGVTLVQLTNPRTGTGVEMTVDETVPWIQVYSADMPDRPAHRRSLAVEPMTCPPDGFNSGTDLWALLPGQSRSAQWTISAL